MEPVRSGIRGELTFTGQWPAPPAELTLVVTKKFPPEGIEDLIIGESLPVSIDTYNYSFFLKPGTYKVVGVAWRAENATWDIISICGLYFNGPDSLVPGEVVIPNSNTIVDSINISVNRSNAHKVTNTKIRGIIEFTGAWPDSIIEARVIATTKFRIISLFPPPPVYELPTLLDIGFSNAIEPGSTTAEYTINAFPGEYLATSVLFFKRGTTLSMEDILYSLSVRGLDIIPYVVQEDSIAKGPNFNIKFE